MIAVRPFAGTPGSPAAISLVELPDPAPGPGEVAIAVAASALNRADLLQMRGLYPPPPGESTVPGLECAGTIAEVGEGVSAWKRGDRVMALLAGGGHSTRVVAPEGQLMAVPPGRSMAEAAALPEVAITAWTNLVYEGRLHAGQTVLITGAASGVGCFAVPLAKALGARVVVAGRDRARLERLRPLGADFAVELGDGFAERVRAEVEGGVDLVLDLVGGEHLDRALGALRDRGTLVLVGVLAGASAPVDLGQILRRRLRIVGSVLRARSRAEKAGLVTSFAELAAERWATGELPSSIDRTFPFERVADAYAAMATGGHLGKLVLEMNAGSGGG
ncbi:MAG TPA: NAD(P)H-quinone oxidoreductase [Thermoanaerobaculia bacterium]|nr:NAD(P)H-quinone oxidoreductase [Thermoanaerobaculia bacterium]